MAWRMATAIVLALLLGSLLFLPFAVNPVDGYRELLGSGFFNLRGLGYTLAKATPLLLIGLATVVAWKTGFAYLGFEGCYLVGAASATWIALLALPGQVLAGMHSVLLCSLCAIAAFVAGGMWAGMVGWLRTRFGGNEVLMSMMTNYLAVLLLQYLVSGPMRAPGDLPQSPRIPEAASFSYLFEGGRAHTGIFIALLCAIVVWQLMRHSKVGYEMLVAGLSPRAALYSGIPVGSRLLLAAALCGGLAALGGMCDVLGVQHRLVDGLSEGTGFVGMVVALLGKLNVIGVALSAFLYAGMTVGADAMQRTSDIPTSLTFMVQSLIILLVLAMEFFNRYQLDMSWWRRRRAATETPALER